MTFLGGLRKGRKTLCEPPVFHGYPQGLCTRFAWNGCEVICTSCYKHFKQLDTTLKNL